MRHKEIKRMEKNRQETRREETSRVEKTQNEMKLLNKRKTSEDVR